MVRSTPFIAALLLLGCGRARPDLPPMVDEPVRDAPQDAPPPSCDLEHEYLVDGVCAPLRKLDVRLFCYYDWVADIQHCDAQARAFVWSPTALGMGSETLDAVDGCELKERTKPIGAWEEVAYDAGEIVLTSENEALVLSDVAIDLTDFEEHDVLSISGSGGVDFPSFEGELTLPPVLAIENLSRFVPGVPFELAWTPRVEGETTLHLLATEDRSIECTAQDADGFVLSAEVTAWMDPDTLEMWLARSSTVRIDVEGEAAVIELTNVALRLHGLSL